MKICIIKLGAAGDVVRTTPILSAIKDKFPNSEIYWITKPDCSELLEGNPLIKKIIPPSADINEIFDILYNLDTEDNALSLAEKIKSKNKFGFCKQGNYAGAFNLPAEYYLNTLFDDEIKITNRKTYQQMIFDAAELEYKKQPCQIFLSKKDLKYAEDFKKNNKINGKKLIGIHMGASSRWPSKVWHEQELKKFIIQATKKGYEIILFGGPNEIESHSKIKRQLENEGIGIFTNNPHNTKKEFCSLVNLCKFIVCSDSLALHVSIALKKKTIGLFFCTSPHEVESYGLLKKLVSPFIYEFFPAKSNQYSEKLVKSISSEQVMEEIEEKTKVVNALIINGDKFLAIKRKSGIHSGKWAFPGGIVEKNESPEQALKRELKEEVGLEMVKIIRKISDYSYLREDNTKTNGTSFLIEVKNKNITLNDEISEYKWLTIEEFEELDHVSGLEHEAMAAIFP